MTRLLEPKGATGYALGRDVALLPFPGHNMLVQYMRDNLRELNERLGQAFQAAGGMPPGELTACRRSVVHGLPIPFLLTTVHTQLVNDLKDCLEYAQQHGLDAVVGYCMAGAQSSDLLVEEADAGVDLVGSFLRDAVPPPATARRCPSAS